MRVLAIAIAILIAATALLIVVERSSWTRERDAQCAAARPLVAARAQKHEIIETIGAPSNEDALGDISEIEKSFGRNEPKMADIKQHLHEGGRLLTYSQSNSIMFVYLSPDGRATNASCFLQ